MSEKLHNQGNTFEGVQRAGDPPADPMHLSYYRPSADGQNRIAVVRGQFKAMVKAIGAIAPVSRERSLALTHLEEACMYAIKAIVVNDPNSTVES